MTLSPPAVQPAAAKLCAQYQAVRGLSETLCQPLAIEDYGIQAMADVSPPKWHLAHTTWFFETFLLLPYLPAYQAFHPTYNYLFNSYYEAVGERHPRPQRGLLSRPTVAQVYQYRAHVDQAMGALLRQQGDQSPVAALTTLGLHHEQQHQELLLTDLKYNLAQNPLRPAYRPDLPQAMANPGPLKFVEFAGGLYTIGHQGEGLAADEFTFDNEGPAHQVYLQDFALANRLVTNGEYLAFMEAGGYQTPKYWLSEGWATIQDQGWQAPLYWEQQDGQWWTMTLAGLQPLGLDQPVTHLSYFEADAFAQWCGYRLPTEAEWEVATHGVPPQGNLLAADYLHPQPATGVEPLEQLYGDTWEWTQSAYLPYPGFRPAAGAVGEYNGKFMCNQMVLRGGSCVTPPGHIRPTYRNFFPPSARWQFSGIRLAA
ncbi:MAG: ergothioneine biosynthesis protein EgtB [Leptolyngbya sp. LCM1.Bin17]|nr:MAG: ergothioneine biosynthesis protein EgtB [Leptolyngbya sp. LCM1.Bin17]